MKPNFGKLQLKRNVKVLLICLGLFGIIGFTGKRHNSRTCQHIKVKIENDSENHFIDENEVVVLLGDTTTEPVTGKPLAEINLRMLEKKLKKACPYIEDVQIGQSLSGDLKVRIKQITPIARLRRENSRDFYLCNNKTLVQVSNKFTARVLVIDGATWQLLKPDSANLVMRTEAFELITKISENTLLSKMIVQATIDSHGEYTLYPQIAKHKIVFGKPESIDGKLEKLTAFYDRIVPAKGWDAFEKVILKYNNQIVCE